MLHVFPEATLFPIILPLSTPTLFIFPDEFPAIAPVSISSIRDFVLFIYTSFKIMFCTIVFSWINENSPTLWYAFEL